MNCQEASELGNHLVMDNMGLYRTKTNSKAWNSLEYAATDLDVAWFLISRGLIQVSVCFSWNQRNPQVPKPLTIEPLCDQTSYAMIAPYIGLITARNDSIIVIALLTWWLLAGRRWNNKKITRGTNQLCILDVLSCNDVMSSIATPFCTD